jgi:alpha-L-arabinofuranosidase
MEYMQWCIDMNMEPLLAVWSGLSLGRGQAAVTGAAMTPYINEVLNELEFLLGDSGTTYGALRSKYGVPDPYKLRYIEIGNEDFVGCSSYASRFTAMYNAIHAKYPDLQIITSTDQSNCLPRTLPAGVWTDVHFYLRPDEFVAKFNQFDQAKRGDGYGILVGEYASTKGNDGKDTYWSSMQGSCAEAVFMIGMERNSDIVKMASFAPLFEHFGMAQWSVSLAPDRPRVYFRQFLSSVRLIYLG